MHCFLSNTVFSFFSFLLFSSISITIQIFRAPKFVLTIKQTIWFLTMYQPHCFVYSFVSLSQPPPTPRRPIKSPNSPTDSASDYWCQKGAIKPSRAESGHKVCVHYSWLVPKNFKMEKGPQIGDDEGAKNRIEELKVWIEPDNWQECDEGWQVFNESRREVAKDG